MTLEDGLKAVGAFRLLAEKLAIVREVFQALEPLPSDASRLAPLDHDVSGNLAALAALMEAQAEAGGDFAAPVVSPVSGKPVDPALIWDMTHDLLSPLAYEAGELFRKWDEGTAAPSYPEVAEYAAGLLVVYREVNTIREDLFPERQGA